MTDQRKAPEHHLQWNNMQNTRQLQRDLPPGHQWCISSGQPCFAMLFASQPQWNLCKSYAILRINAMMEMSIFITANISVMGVLNSVLNKWSSETFLSITANASAMGAINSVLNSWSWETYPYIIQNPRWLLYSCLSACVILTFIFFYKKEVSNKRKGNLYHCYKMSTIFVNYCCYYFKLIIFIKKS